MSYQSRCRPIRQVLVEDAEEVEQEAVGQENGNRLEEENHTDDEEEENEGTEEKEELEKHFHNEWPDLSANSQNKMVDELG